MPGLCHGAFNVGGTADAAARQPFGRAEEKKVKNGENEKFHSGPLGISMMAGRTFIEVGARRTAFMGGCAFLCDVKGRLGSF